MVSSFPHKHQTTVYDCGCVVQVVGQIDIRLLKPYFKIQPASPGSDILCLNYRFNNPIFRLNKQISHSFPPVNFSLFLKHLLYLWYGFIYLENVKNIHIFTLFTWEGEVSGSIPGQSKNLNFMFPPTLSKSSSEFILR